jgi:hypothetical protein
MDVPRGRPAISRSRVRNGGSRHGRTHGPRGDTVPPRTLRDAGSVVAAGCSGCDWGQGGRRLSTGQPVRVTADWQSPGSSTRRPCRNRSAPGPGAGYPASSAVSGDGRRTVCRLGRFVPVRGVIDLWARTQDGSPLTRNGSGRAEATRPLEPACGAGPRISSARADNPSRSRKGAGIPRARLPGGQRGHRQAGTSRSRHGECCRGSRGICRASASVPTPARSVAVLHPSEAASGR